jgi:hypothetical protein
MNKAEQKVYPDTQFAAALRACGCETTFLWEMPGPKGTRVAWLSSYGVTYNGHTTLVIVETMDNGPIIILPDEYVSSDLLKLIKDIK